jgi:antitoxin component YwqK of YwqJK toxin-antitoxin module
MKYIIFLCLVYSCTGKNKKVFLAPADKIPTTFQNITAPYIALNKDTILFKQQKYSGFIYELNDKLDTVLCNGYVNGLLQGNCKKYYANKQLMESRNYLLGKKNGPQISYWQNGNKRFEFTAVNDLYEGALKEWGENGQLIHFANYKNGQEDGVQKLWYDNGKIRANYVIRDGKRYGLLGTKNCINVSDSIFNIK